MTPWFIRLIPGNKKERQDLGSTAIAASKHPSARYNVHSLRPRRSAPYLKHRDRGVLLLILNTYKRGLCLP